MNSKKEEKILEDLLYEHSSKKMLEGLVKSKPKHSSWLVKVAALIGFLLIALIGNQILSTREPDRFAKAKSVYSFPLVSKSRSNEIHKVDSYLKELNDGNYNTVLLNLQSDTLSEKDLFVKANIYYILDSLVPAHALIKRTDWNNSYNVEEIAWLNFLIEYRRGTPLTELRSEMQLLPNKHKEKAKSLLTE